MGKPLTIQEDDDELIERLKERAGLDTKIAVVRMALALLEEELKQRGRSERWRRAAAAVSRTSKKVNIEFQRQSRIKRTGD